MAHDSRDALVLYAGDAGAYRTAKDTNACSRFDASHKAFARKDVHVPLLTSEIDIAASREVIWSVLVDFDSYADWNPVEVRARGNAVVGSILEHTAQLPGRKPMTFKAQIFEATAPSSLAWQGRIGVPGLFDVKHHFEIDSLAADHSRLRQFEHFSGVLVPFMRALLRDTRAAFDLANQAIKERAERLAHERPGATSAAGEGRSF